MTTFDTPRAVDLGQLAAELGTVDDPAPLTMLDYGDHREITVHDDTITQAQLEAAIEAHVPQPPPPGPAALLQSQVDELTDLTFELLDLLMGM